MPVRPGAELLRKCEWPLLPDPAKPVAWNSEANADVAQKFRDCDSRHTKLIEWFGEAPPEPAAK